MINLEQPQEIGKECKEFKRNVIDGTIGTKT